MQPLVTESIVLHTFHYLETSLIIRLMTREAGIQSVLARGARNSRKRFGGALDLFAQGAAEIHMRPNRELQALTGLDVTRARPRLATDVGRFTAGSMIAELALRSSSDEPSPALFNAVEESLDRIVEAEGSTIVESALSGAWLIVASLGFSPSLDGCANCDSVFKPDAAVGFSHAAGGALCARCRLSAAGSRVLPSSARDAIRFWVGGGRVSGLPALEAKAHQRLLREFVGEHVSGDRELRAFKVWEEGSWSVS